jgi:hypothetical protein
MPADPTEQEPTGKPRARTVGSKPRITVDAAKWAPDQAATSDFSGPHLKIISAFWIAVGLAVWGVVWAGWSALVEELQRLGLPAPRLVGGAIAVAVAGATAALVHFTYKRKAARPQHCRPSLGAAERSSD